MIYSLFCFDLISFFLDLLSKIFDGRDRIVETILKLFFFFSSDKYFRYVVISLSSSNSCSRILFLNGTDVSNLGYNVIGTLADKGSLKFNPAIPAKFLKLLSLFS